MNFHCENVKSELVQSCLQQLPFYWLTCDGVTNLGVICSKFLNYIYITHPESLFLPNISCDLQTYNIQMSRARNVMEFHHAAHFAPSSGQISSTGIIDVMASVKVFHTFHHDSLNSRYLFKVKISTTLVLDSSQNFIWTVPENVY